MKFSIMKSVKLTVQQLLVSLFSLLQVVARMLDRYVSGCGIPEADLADNPYPHYTRLRRLGPVLRKYEINGWCVNGFDEVKEVFLDQRFSVDPRNSIFVTRLLELATLGDSNPHFYENPSLLNLDPPEHTRIRKLVRSGFLHKYVESLAPNIERIIEECLSDVEDGGNFDLMEKLAKPLPAYLIADILGAPRSGRKRIQKWSDFIASNSRSYDVQSAKHANQYYNELRDYLIGLVEEKRKNLGEDLLSTLIMAEDEGDQLSHEELLSTCFILLLAGHETTTRLIGNMIYLLLSHPEQLQEIRDNPELIPDAIEESLRFESPVQRMSRVALEDIDFHGSKIKKNQMVDVLIGAANRDPKANDSPEKFIVRRSKRKHISFGYGIHLCLGAQLARLEASVTLKHLLSRFPEMLLADSQIAWSVGGFIRGPDKLIINLGKQIISKPTKQKRHSQPI